MNTLKTVKISEPKLTHSHIHVRYDSVHSKKLVVNTTISATLALTDTAGFTQSLEVTATSGISACGRYVNNDSYEFDAGIIATLDDNFYTLEANETNDDIQEVIDSFAEDFNLEVSINDLCNIITLAREKMFYNVRPEDFDISTDEADYVYKCAYYTETEDDYLEDDYLEDDYLEDDYLEFDEVGNCSVEQVLAKGRDFSFVVACYDNDYTDYEEDKNAEFVDFYYRSEAEEYIEKHKDRCKHKILNVELVEIFFENNHPDDGEEWIAHVDVLIDGYSADASFYVQMINGRCMSHMGCWVTTDGGDMEFSQKEIIIYQAFGVESRAENHAKAYLRERYTYHNTNFNCSFNDCSLYIKEDTENDTFTLVISDDAFNYVSDYGTPETAYDSFSTKEEAEAWLDEHRTGKHFDFDGLKAAMSALGELNY